MWNKTKKNVENVITKYIYYSLSVDNNSTSDIKDNYVLDKLVEGKSLSYTNISNEEKDFISTIGVFGTDILNNEFLTRGENYEKRTK